MQRTYVLYHKITRIVKADICTLHARCTHAARTLHARCTHAARTLLARLFSLRVSPRVFCVCTRACRAAASLVRAAPTEPVLTDNTAYCSDASFCTCASESPVSRAIFSTLNPSASILRAACSICLFIICRTIIKHRMRAVVIAAVYSNSVPRANLRLYSK